MQNGLVFITEQIKTHLQRISTDIIEVGNLLIEAKKQVEHGDWQLWLDHNFKLSYRTAAKFMSCAERFGKVPMSALLSSSQMMELLALPAAVTQTFIEQKAAEDNPVQDMSIKQLREEIKTFKQKKEKAMPVVQSEFVVRKLADVFSSVNFLLNYVELQKVLEKYAKTNPRKLDLKIAQLRGLATELELYRSIVT